MLRRTCKDGTDINWQNNSLSLCLSISVLRLGNTPAPTAQTYIETLPELMMFSAR